MEATNPVPEALSHRQLMALLQTAVPEAASPVADAEADGARPLEAVLRGYGEASQRLLEALEQQGERGLAQGRSPRQLMAIGALRAHVQLALQALAASQA